VAPVVLDAPVCALAFEPVAPVAVEELADGV
jgi:hypothetical protein